MTNFVINNPDGTVSVVQLTPDYVARFSSEQKAIDAEYKRLQGKGGLVPGAAKVANNIELPDDREFRAAWTWKTPEPVIDIDALKAVDVTKQRLRAERAPELARLDIEYQKADEQGDAAKKAEVAALKQVLRDVTATVPTPAEGVEVADQTFIDELRAVQLPVLGA